MSVKFTFFYTFRYHCHDHYHTAIVVVVIFVFAIIIIVIIIDIITGQFPKSFHFLSRWYAPYMELFRCLLFLIVDVILSSQNLDTGGKLKRVTWSNGPFAASGHMVQTPPCWRASYPLGHPKQRKFKFVLVKSLCSGCPSGQLALQHGGFCTM